MGIVSVLFAEKPKRTDSFLSREEDWVVMGLLMGVMLAGAVAFWLVDRWRKRVVVVPAAERELTEYREMYERGEITEAEYVRLRDRVAQRVKNPVAGTPARAGGAPEPPAAAARPLTWEDMEEAPPKADEPPPGGAGGPQQPPPPV